MRRMTDLVRRRAATDKAPPELRDIQGVTYRWGGDEHGILELTDPSEPIVVGDKLLIRTSARVYCISASNVAAK